MRRAAALAVVMVVIGGCVAPAGGQGAPTNVAGAQTRAPVNNAPAATDPGRGTPVPALRRLSTNSVGDPLWRYYVTTGRAYQPVAQ